MVVMRASQLTTKETKLLCKKIEVAANARGEHFDKVAKKMGYMNAQAAFNTIGSEFIKKARIGAPSIMRQ